MNSFLEDTAFNPEKVTTQLIIESDFTKEIKITMHKNTVMKEHKTPFPIVIHVLQGAIEFDYEEKTHELTMGDIISLSGGIPHSLAAKANSIVRLTLAKHDSYKRVDGLVK